MTHLDVTYAGSSRLCEFGLPKDGMLTCLGRLICLSVYRARYNQVHINKCAAPVNSRQERANETKAQQQTSSGTDANFRSKSLFMAHLLLLFFFLSLSLATALTGFWQIFKVIDSTCARQLVGEINAYSQALFGVSARFLGSSTAESLTGPF